MGKFVVFLCTMILILGFVSTVQADQISVKRLKADTNRPATPTPVPEPLSIALFGGGLLGLYGLTKRFGKN
jgi:hypothetical protein